jgi:hypothetical protein
MTDVTNTGSLGSTTEKDVTLSTSRDADRGIERTSMTGTDDKGRVYVGDVRSREDVGEAENQAAELSAAFGRNRLAGDLAVNQLLRNAQADADFIRRVAEDAQSIKHRANQQALDYDATLRQITAAGLSDANVTRNKDALQATRHGDLAIDRQWNIDETANASVVALGKLADAVGVDSRSVLAAYLTALAEAVRAKS